MDDLFKIWRDKWEIFDNKFCHGFFMYTYNYNSYNKIEEYYSNYIKTELDKYTDNIIKLNKIESQKIKILGYENGLETDCDFSEIIKDLKKIKKMELIVNLSDDIDGNECAEIPKVSEQETSKIQRILKSMDENFKNNNDNVTSNKINSKDNNDNDNDLDEETKTLKNNCEDSNSTKKFDEDYYNDIDGEPL